MQAYYQLAKPGIVYGNLITAVAGFWFGARGWGNGGVWLTLVAGMALVIGSACVVNNYMDRGLDAVMARTRRRPLVSGVISGRAALVYGGVLGVVGLALLVAFTNGLVVAIALVGWIDYVLLYGWAKRRSVHGTLVGSVSGATPIVAGYVAATGRLDGGAWLLFAVLVAWQMPHFYAIALYRQADYAAAKLPVLPVAWGRRATLAQIAVYTGAFVAATLALAVAGYAGRTYLAVMLAVGLAWLAAAARGFWAGDVDRWARGLFRGSLIVLLVFSALISLNAVLP